MPNWKKVIVSGSNADLSNITASNVTLTNIANAGTDTDKFLVLDSSDNVDFRTGAQVLLDIGATACTGTVTSIATTSPITGGTITSTGTIGITQATTSADGYLSSTDWDTFNNKTTCTGTVDTSGTPVDNDFAKFTDANTIEGRSAAEMRSDLNVANGATACTGTVTSVGGTGTVSGITLSGTVTTSGNLTLGGTFSTTTSSITNFNTGVGTIVDGCGFTTCTGDITGVTAGNGLTGGATSGNATLNIGAGTGIDVSADAIAVDVSDFMSNGVNNRIMTATGADTMNAEASLTFDGVTLTVGSKATIGTNHSNTGTLSTITGGTFNTGSGACGFIGGGCSNNIGSLSLSSVIVGGTNNTANNTNIAGNDNFIGAGCNNSISSYCDGCNFIGGGCGNTISGYGDNNSIVGGKNNSNSGYYSSILGGKNNTISTCNQTFIIGSDITATANCYAFMNNACISGTTRTTTLVETSAKKHKECILPLQDQIKNIQKLEPVNFQWKENGKEDIGFIAEEVEKIYPNLVSYEEDGEIHGVQYSKLTTVLVKALQQQQEQIEELKKEILIIKNNLNG